jgi:hypothetical protein
MSTRAMMRVATMTVNGLGQRAQQRACCGADSSPVHFCFCTARFSVQLALSDCKGLEAAPTAVQPPRRRQQSLALVLLHHWRLGRDCSTPQPSSQAIAPVIP